MARTEAGVLISVVIPAYNYARTLARAVESVCAQLDGVPAEYFQALRFGGADAGSVAYHPAFYPGGA